MVLNRTYHGLSLFIAKADSERICYILLPEGLKDDTFKWMDTASQAHGVNLAVISGIDWNDALTPWSAEGVFKKNKPFGGHAETFFKDLREDFFPSIETSLGIKHPERYLAGISLSGLFAVWSCFKDESLRGIASISGSLWYDGFAEWAANRQPSPSIEKIFISLGDREKKSKDKRMAEVENATTKVVNGLSERGACVNFVLEEGITHFSPIIPRLDKAFEWLF